MDSVGSVRLLLLLPPPKMNAGRGPGTSWFPSVQEHLGWGLRPSVRWSVELSGEGCVPGSVQFSTVVVLNRP